MKRILLGFAAFALTMTSCQKSAVVDDISDGQNELSFGVYQGKSTKSAELTNKELVANGVKFPLYAYKGDQTVGVVKYFEETLSCDAQREWSTEKPRFFPDGSKLQLYAYYATGSQSTQHPIAIPGATYTGPAENTPNSFPTLAYEIQSPQVDLIATTVTDNEAKSIALSFSHILSQINFGVKGYYGVQITISNINIVNVNSRGIFSFNPLPANWGWTSQNTLESYPYIFAGGTTAANSVFKTPGTDKTNESSYTYILGDGGKWGPGKGVNSGNIWYVTGANNATVQGTAIDGQTPTLQNSLMLMPQKLAAGTTNAYVTFNYTFQDSDGNYVLGTTANAPKLGTFDLNMNNTTNQYADEWKPNLRYVYVIDFTGFLDGEIMTFTVDVDTNEWENYDGAQGIVLLSTMGEPIFRKNIQTIAVGTTYSSLTGHIFSDITWDWSTYEMGAQFATTGQQFTISFANVKFNGNKLTVNAPKGFKVKVDAGGTLATSAAVNVPTQTLVFVKD